MILGFKIFGMKLEKPYSFQGPGANVVLSQGRVLMWYCPKGIEFLKQNN